MQNAVVHHGFRFYVAKCQASTLVEVKLHNADQRPAKRLRLSEDGAPAGPPNSLLATLAEPGASPPADAPDTRHTAHVPFGLLRVHGLPPADNA